MSAILRAAQQHCDLEDRLTAFPPEYAVRGLWFSMLRAELRRASADLAARYDEELGVHEAVTFKMYPLAEYLPRLVAAAALIATPAGVADGMQTLHRATLRTFASSLLGRVIVSLVRPSPLAMFRQIERSRAHVANYGRLVVEEVTPRELAITFIDDPLYIESANLGGVLSVFDACKIEPTTTVELRSRFEGTIRARW